MPADPRLPEISLDPQSLYREDVFTDLKAGTIRRLVPVTAEGHEDAARPIVFLGQAQILTPVGALPLNFEIPGATFGEALRNFPAASKEAIERTVKELQDMRREQASSLIVPEAGAAALNNPTLMGGRIKMP